MKWWRETKSWLKSKHALWLKQRIPESNTTQLNINNTFILPSAFGWSCIGIVICLFILGTNFQNNVILLFCYFLLSLVLLSVLHSYFFFVQHKLIFSDITPDFENRRFFLPLKVCSTLRYQGGELFFKASSKGKKISVGNDCTTAEILLPAFKRGIHPCPKLSIYSSYGFGLFTCWTHLTPKKEVCVYPAIKKTPLILHKADIDSTLQNSSDTQYMISDNLQGIREYKDTDPLNHVSWKHLAKGQGMLTKDFNENTGVSAWLRLSDYMQLGEENALQALCFHIQQLDKDHVAYGIDLGSTKTLPQSGPQHLRHCLELLATYKLTTDLDIIQSKNGTKNTRSILSMVQRSFNKSKLPTSQSNFNE